MPHNQAFDYFSRVDFNEGQGLRELLWSAWNSEIWSELLEIKSVWVSYIPASIHIIKLSIILSLSISVKDKAFPI